MSGIRSKIPKQKLLSAYLLVGILIAIIVVISIGLQSYNDKDGLAILKIEAAGNYGTSVTGGFVTNVTNLPNNSGSSGNGTTNNISGNNTNQGTDTIGGGPAQNIAQDNAQVGTIPNYVRSIIVNGPIQASTYSPTVNQIKQHYQAQKQSLIWSIINAVIQAIVGNSGLAPQVNQSGADYAQTGVAYNPSSAAALQAQQSSSGQSTSPGSANQNLGTNQVGSPSNSAEPGTSNSAGTNPSISGSSAGSTANSGSTTGAELTSGTANSSFNNGASGTSSGTGAVNNQSNTTANTTTFSNQTPLQTTADQIYTDQKKTNLMCFVGPAIMGPVLELTQKIPYIGNILSEIFAAFITYQTYSRCGEYYGGFDYSPTTGQPSFYYNQPLTTGPTSTNGLGIIVSGPYENLKGNAIGLMRRVPVLGSPLSTSILLNK